MRPDRPRPPRQNDSDRLVNMGNHAGVRGSVAQIFRDSLRDSKVLVGLDEQAHTSELSHDELAHLQCCAEAAWIAAYLVRPGDGMAG